MLFILSLGAVWLRLLPGTPRRTLLYRSLPVLLAKFGRCHHLLLILILLVAVAPARSVRLGRISLPVPIAGREQLDAVHLRPAEPMPEHHVQKEGRLGQVLERVI